jgi:hypothetical protein
VRGDALRVPALGARAHERVLAVVGVGDAAVRLVARPLALGRGTLDERPQDGVAAHAPPEADVADRRDLAGAELRAPRLEPEDGLPDPLGQRLVLLDRDSFLGEAAHPVALEAVRLEV